MERHPLAGHTVQLQCAPGPDSDFLNAQAYIIEDWWLNVSGRSWMVADGDIACLLYALRSGIVGLPTDDNVLYGQVGGLGYLIHESEIRESE